VRRLAILPLAGFVLAACTATLNSDEEVLCSPIGERTVLILAAQAVPSATLMPCMSDFPAGWSFAGSDIRSGRARFWLESDRAGVRAIEVELTRTCDVSGLDEAPNAGGELDVRVYVEPLTFQPYAANRYFTFTGGCAIYRYRFTPTDEWPNLALEANDALTFLPRSTLVAHVEAERDQTLCGASAPPCVVGD
jgi:hypothetical protein